ncbi:hypothetical protein [Klebsiella phage GADU21]|nr:hypothetical protein [Klebsiella phage GADU21]
MIGIECQLTTYVGYSYSPYTSAPTYLIPNHTYTL